jgi:hypothetical protein
VRISRRRSALWQNPSALHLRLLRPNHDRFQQFSGRLHRRCYRPRLCDSGLQALETHQDYGLLEIKSFSGGRLPRLELSSTLLSRLGRQQSSILPEVKFLLEQPVLSERIRRALVLCWSAYRSFGSSLFEMTLREPISVRRAWPLCTFVLNHVSLAIDSNPLSPSECGGARDVDYVTQHRLNIRRR